MKAGTKILVYGWTASLNEVWRPAKIARRTKDMGNLPGYHPVKFDDGGILMVHESRFKVA